MKILHIFGELKPSGGEAMMLSAAPTWLPVAEMHILSTGYESVGVYAEKLSTAGYVIHHIPFRKNFSFFIKVAQLIRKEKFDIVHMHTQGASPWFALTSRLALGSSTILIRTVHHIFKFTGWLRLRVKMERYLLRSWLNVTFISNSPSGKKNELNRYNSDNILIPNWYDSTFYSPSTDVQRTKARKNLGYTDDICIFMSLGGNWYYKNYGLIVEALALIPADINVLYVQLGVQGEGMPLETAARRLGVTERLRCMGIVDDPKLYLYAADVYMMPSSEEGFGVAAVEAMACGLPAILSDVEALCDFKEDITGIDYINPTPQEIADAMIKLAHLSIAERRNLGAKIAAATQKHYGLDSGAAGYMQLYQRLTSTL
jgi:glycosyltransferase involved in cell wall biosynthesis